MRRAADHVIPVQLELGGKSANIVFSDANIDLAAMWAMIAIFTASSQICTAGS
jgi:acyl-CoA reductase-like NAD-dependent aldehyde dehydrogenase